MLIGLAIYVALYNKDEVNEVEIDEPTVDSSAGLPIAESQIFTEPASTGLDLVGEEVPTENSLISNLGPNEIDTEPIISALFVEDPATSSTTASTTDPYVLYLGQNNDGIFKKNLGLSDAVKVGNLETTKIKKWVWAIENSLPKLIAIEQDRDTRLLKIVTWPEASTTPQLGNVYDLTISPDKKRLFYIEETGGGVTGYSTDLEFKKRDKIFSSPFASWKINWFSSTTIALQSKPSVQAFGFVYFLDLKTKKIVKILGDKLGLSTLPSPKGGMIALSESVSNQTKLSIFKINSGEYLSPTLNTLAEKCVWSSDEEFLFCAVPKDLLFSDYPDSWYRGEITFNDELWRININSGETKLLKTVSKERLVDAENLFLNKENTTLFLTNRLNSRLMAFDLKESL